MAKKKYSINRNRSELWKADVQKSVLFYNDWFLNFAPATYINARQEAINKVEDAELREALRQHRLSGRGRPRKNVPHKSRTDGYERITTIASIVKMEKLRAIALRETLTIKEVLEACMDLAIEAYEKKHGEIQVSTMSRKGKKLFK